MSTALEINRLNKSYGVRKVIKDLSFSVQHGEVFGLLGTNGAGKTTTLECIEGILQYDNGTIMRNGTIGVQLQSSSLPVGMKALKAIRLFSRWNHVSIDRGLIHNLGFDDIQHKTYKEMSTGQKRRLHLMLAMIGDPDILFLDEPTAGLDVEGRAALHAEIRKLKQLGKTIIIASHDMAEVESLCDRIAILKSGTLAFIGTALELAHHVNKQSRILLKLTAPLQVTNLIASSYESEELSYVTFSADHVGDALLELLTEAKRQHIEVMDVRIERSSLEEGFMDIAKEDSI